MCFRKGGVKPISVVVKVRQGRKVATLVTGFEAFFIEADDLAEELRKRCAGSASSMSLLPCSCAKIILGSRACSIASTGQSVVGHGGHGSGKPNQGRYGSAGVQGRVEEVA